ncbi:MAG: hypothetical protein Sv326_0276 [Candidatus Fermentimicrarchaeum limneticum]|uniref:Periplasmic copper-binding protein NosD beta helix domain-containing protein n=1 Tax=Fermentimicrarchaeum limneticum TaxID=2795018 RepID=A0A7D5XCB7_FERL1|nr:MAG: hypothetical protein Sv326_0276 [Candidatus Fermentimicrarchaeum limneticum]
MRKEVIALLLLVIVVATFWFFTRPKEEQVMCPAVCKYGCITGTAQCREPPPLVCPSTCKLGCKPGTTQCKPEVVEPRATRITGCGALNETSEMVFNLHSDEQCLVIQRDNIILDCMSNMILGNGKTGSYGIYLKGRKNVTIQNCVIENYGSGIVVDSSSNISILNVRVVDNLDDGILISSSKSVLLDRALSLKNSNGLFIISSENLVLSNNSFSENVFGILIVSSEIASLSGNRICSSWSMDMKCENSQIMQSEGNTCGLAVECEVECSLCSEIDQRPDID